MSSLEEQLLFQIKAARLPQPVREFQFAKPRRWRFDFAYPAHKVAVEVEGGVWIGGRHMRGRGYESDCEKYNEASLAGWRVLRFTPAMIRSGEALVTVERAVSSPSEYLMDGEIPHGR